MSLGVGEFWRRVELWKYRFAGLQYAACSNQNRRRGTEHTTPNGVGVLGCQGSTNLTPLCGAVELQIVLQQCLVADGITKKLPHPRFVERNVKK